MSIQAYDYGHRDGFIEGVTGETERITKLLEDPEWHELTKSYTSQETDLVHDSDYCSGCQIIREVKRISETLIKEMENKNAAK